jgi:hypothetical protein
MLHGWENLVDGVALESAEPFRSSTVPGTIRWAQAEAERRALCDWCDGYGSDQLARATKPVTKGLSR